MPKAFDRHQLSITHNPAQRIDMTLPRTPRIEPIDLFAGCGPLVEGVKGFGQSWLQETLVDLNTQRSAAVTGGDGSLVEILDAAINDLRAKLLNPTQLTLLGAGVQGLGDAIWGLLTCGDLGAPLVNAITEAVTDIGESLTPGAILARLQEVIDALTDNVFFRGLVEFAEFLGEGVENFVLDAAKGATELINLICGVLTCNPAAGLTAISVAAHTATTTGGTTPFTIIKGLQDIFAPIIANPLVQGLIEFAEHVGVEVGNFFLDLVNGAMAIAEALCSLLTTGQLPEEWGSWSNTPLAMLTQLADFIATLLDNPLVDGLRGLIEGTGAVLLDTIRGAIQFFTDLAGLLGQFMSGPQAIIDFLGGILGPDGLLGWIANLPFIGPLVAKLTGITPSGETPLGLSDLEIWARGLLTGQSTLPAGNLVGQISDAVLASVSVSHISASSPNLMSQGNFNNENTVQPGDGGAWDGDTTATGTGGSMKFTANGSMQQRFSTQVIKVNNGDRVDVTAKVKTSGFTAASGREMKLSIIPWKLVANAMTAQPEVVIATRTTASVGSWAPLSGATYVVANDIIRLTVRLSTTANPGATIWFDDVNVQKTGGMLQGNVDNLLPTWEGFWAAVFGGSGAGKIWSDAITALSTVKINAGLGISKGDTANGNALGIIDSIGKAVFGEATYQTLPGQVKTTLQHFINRLFGINTVGSELTGDVLPPLDASTILYGELPTARLNMPSIGATINPSAGSGALLIRSASNPVAPRSYSRTYAPDGFFTSLQVASSDISCLKTDGNPGTGTRNDFAGAFKVANAGWYQVELSVRINVGFANGAFSCAPVLFKGSTLAGCTAYKIGSDSHTIYVGGFPVTQVQHRFVQTSWIVYLAANEIVRAGFDCLYAGAATSGLGGESGTGTSGTETYFSISLLNKSFA